MIFIEVGFRCMVTATHDHLWHSLSRHIVGGHGPGMLLMGSPGMPLTAPGQLREPSLAAGRFCFLSPPEKMCLALLPPAGNSHRDRAHGWPVQLLIGLHLQSWLTCGNPGNPAECTGSRAPGALPAAPAFSCKVLLQAGIRFDGAAGRVGSGCTHAMPGGGSERLLSDDVISRESCSQFSGDSRQAPSFAWSWAPAYLNRHTCIFVCMNR